MEAQKYTDDLRSNTLQTQLMPILLGSLLSFKQFSKIEMPFLLKLVDKYDQGFDATSV